MTSQKPQLLFIAPGPAMPKASLSYCLRFEWLSKQFGGDIIAPVLKSSSGFTQAGSFTFHELPYYAGNGFIRNTTTFFSTLSLFIRLRYKEKKKYAAVISPNPLVTGLTALIITRISGIKNIIEVNGNFKEALKFNRKGEITLTFSEKIKDSMALWFTKMVLTRCNAIKTLYPEQFSTLSLQKKHQSKVFSFHDFVPIQHFVNHPKEDKKFLLLMGFPWYLKGVDLLIEAFKKISPEFPEYSMKVVGWNPDGREYFEKMADGNLRIELCNSVEYEEVISLMTSCSVYVLASRTEGLARVIIEAMASCKPIIAANVGGTATMIRHEETGLLFEKENVDQLTACIRRMLGDKQFADSCAQKAHVEALARLSEEIYVKGFSTMVKELNRD